MKAEQLLSSTGATIANRGQAYGGRENSFQVIADFWSVWLSKRLGQSVSLAAPDAAMMMGLMKVARISGNILHEDSYVDLAGYTALAAEIALPPSAIPDEVPAKLAAIYATAEPANKTAAPNLYEQVAAMIGKPIPHLLANPDDEAPAAEQRDQIVPVPPLYAEVAATGGEATGAAP